MKILIIEDEPRAASRLERLIRRLEPACEIVGKLPSVAGAVDWFRTHASPDLVFMDVRLEDGESFDILAQVDVDSPLVFCTAYSDYALRAFAVNSIDYLLKPVVREDLSRALARYRRFQGFRMATADWPEFPREDSTAEPPHAYRQQFLVALAGKFQVVRTSDIAAASSYLKGTQLIDRGGARWLLDESLVTVERAVDPLQFARVSRQWLVRDSLVTALTRTADGYRVSVAGLDEALAVSR